MQRSELEHLIRAATGRKKDWPFVATMLRHGIVQVPMLQERIDQLALDSAHKQRLHHWVAAQSLA